MPRFTVVVPLYNKAAYVHRCMDSIRGQSLADYEVIVVDDGSTDEGPEMIQERLGSGDQLIFQENAGPGAARNRAVAAGSGELVACLDTDDEWNPEHLATFSALADRYPDAGMLTAAYASVGEQDPPGEPVLLGGEEEGLIEDFFGVTLRRGRGHPIRGMFCHTSTVVFRRRAFEAMGGYAPVYIGEDIDLWGRIAFEYPVAYVDRVLGLYHRDVEGSICFTWDYAKRPIRPPFLESAERALADDHVPQPMVPSVMQFCAGLLTEYACRLMAAGCPREARAAVDEAMKWGRLPDGYQNIRWTFRMPFPLYRVYRALRSAATRGR
ncbi:MAG: glycosyltransferase [Armatimonadia bacterium]|nr:glycosyltransferase [Armatimonadia bacterium]